MLYYIAPVLGNGNDDNPRRPSVPAGISWVGADGGDSYLIATAVEVEGLTALTDAELATVCEERELNLPDVQSWYVG